MNKCDSVQEVTRQTRIERVWDVGIAFNSFYNNANNLNNNNDDCIRKKDNDVLCMCVFVCVKIYLGKCALLEFVPTFGLHFE